MRCTPIDERHGYQTDDQRFIVVLLYFDAVDVPCIRNDEQRNP